MTNNPCYKCENRNGDCHAHCSLWKEYEVRHQEELRLKAYAKMLKNDYEDFRYKAITKTVSRIKK